MTINENSNDLNCFQEGRGKEITFSKTVKSALPLLLLGTARLLGEINKTKIYT